MMSHKIVVVAAMVVVVVAVIVVMLLVLAVKPWRQRRGSCRCRCYSCLRRLRCLASSSILILCGIAAIAVC